MFLSEKDSTAAVPHPTPQSVATASLRANPHNPRMLFDELPLRALAESIQRVGILVPLTVYRASGSEKYTILDGQRRWICATRLKLDTVPINEVAEPSTAQNIVTMFQIHKLRKDWELMPTALKLGVLMKEMEEYRDAPLAELTGLDVAVVTRCKKLLSYSKYYQDMMLVADPEDRIKADFFIELYPIIHDRILQKTKRFTQEEIIDAFLRKYQNRSSGFKSITDFRKIKQHISTARSAGREDDILYLLEEFIKDDKITIDDLELGEAKIHREAAVLTRNLARLAEQLGELDPDAFLGEEELWLELEELVEVIRGKLAAADRRPI